MALTSTTEFDFVGQTQTLTYFDPSQIDQITYSSGAITFGAISTYNLSKSDLILYNQYLQVFYQLLIVNFPSITSQLNGIWPLCNFSITETNVGTKKIVLNETSSGNTVVNINYVPIATSAAFTARASPVTVSIQEFQAFCLLMNPYTNQVSLN
jgi:hypothetical protein